MELTDHDVQQILALVERSDFETIDIEWKGLKLSLKRGGRPASAVTVQVEPAAGEPIENPTDNRGGPPLPSPPSPPARVSPKPEEPVNLVVPDGWITVHAPTMGTFYESPEPGADPFVTTGSRIKADDTLALIEVMKVYSAVFADVPGTIRHVLVKDNELVEYDQPLFVIEPDA